MRDRPREKIIRRGPRSLSDAELLAVLLGSGKQGRSALSLAKDILGALRNDLHALARCEYVDLLKFSGVGEAKALRLVAALELGRRREVALEGKALRMGNSESCFRFLRPLLADLSYEEFHVLCLNHAGCLLGSQCVSQGGVTSTVVDAKRVLRAALSYAGCTSLVFAHNHPSGQCFPSEADLQLTNKLERAARLLDMAVLDHLIVAGRSYYSFADQGLLRFGADKNRRSSN